MELSRREKEIAVEVASGRSNIEIGRALCISHKTVQKHIRAIFRKWEVGSRTAVAVLALKEGLLPLDVAAERVRDV